jgi:hypothetical protein
MKLQPDAAGTACGDATHEPALLFRTFRPDRSVSVGPPCLGVIEELFAWQPAKRRSDRT